MSFSSTIKRYVQGLLLLVLAGFILGAISYISTIVPDSILTPSGVSTAQYEILHSESRDVAGVGRQFFNLDAQITTDSDHVYFVAVNFTGGANNIVEIGVGDAILTYWDSPKLHDGWGYLVIPTGTTFSFYSVVFNVAGTCSTYLFKSPAGTDPTVVLDVFSQSTTAPPPAPSINTKLIINFIGWTASVILVITALHKFDIPI
jgi:hypothetical protein